MIPIIRPDLPDLEDYSKKIKKVWKSGHLTNNGPFVRELEEKLSSYLKVPEIILVANGTLALQLLFKASGLKGEVITTPLTFLATSNSLLWEGITPVFADVDAETFNIDPISVEKKITKRTTAILAVHLYGNPCDLGELRKIASHNKISLFYDAAHSFGAYYKNKPILSYGDASILSTHATKVFHTIEGGIIATKNKNLAKKLRLMRNFGLSGGEGRVLGINAKMNEFEAVMGLLNLKKTDGWIKLRKERYELYGKLLADIPDIKFQKIVASKYNYAYFPIIFSSKRLREKIEKGLRRNNIESRGYYTSHYSPLAIRFGKSQPKNVPVALGISSRILCLPLYPKLTLQEVEKIARLVKNLYDQR